jgi:hypothetical protein
MFNYYFDSDREGHTDTIRLFEAIGAGDYEGFTSEYVSIELRNTAFEPKRNNMLNLIDAYKIDVLDVNEETNRLANIYISNNIIPARYRYDSAHIAIASVNELDCVLSYNFEHINRDKTKLLVGHVNAKEGYNNITICTSREVLDGELQFF